MRRGLVLAAATLGLVAGGLEAVAAPQARFARPSLRLVDGDPITVRGAGFRPREIVRVTASVGPTKTVRRVRSSVAGRFLVRIPGRAWVGPCSPGLAILALGGRGSRAALRLPAAACPPGPAP